MSFLGSNGALGILPGHKQVGKALGLSKPDAPSAPLVPDAAAAPPPPPTLQTPQVNAAAEEARQAAINRYGAGGTIITGGQGLTGVADTAKKKLLGG